MNISFLIISILGYYTYHESKETIEKKVGLYSQELVQQIVDKIDNKFTEIENSSMLIFGDRLFIEDIGDFFEELQIINESTTAMDNITY